MQSDANHRCIGILDAWYVSDMLSMVTNAPDPSQLYQVVAGDIVRGTGDQVSQQRFLNEVKYADYYAKLIGECLGMRTLELGVVEDSESQSAFYYVPGPEGEDSVVNGFLSTGRRPLTRVIDELRGDH
jgi:hypothetical protein